jgi:hypothetical protein
MPSRHQWLAASQVAAQVISGNQHRPLRRLTARLETAISRIVQLSDSKDGSTPSFLTTIRAIGGVQRPRMLLAGMHRSEV